MARFRYVPQHPVPATGRYIFEGSQGHLCSIIVNVAPEGHAMHFDVSYTDQSNRWTRSPFAIVQGGHTMTRDEAHSVLDVIFHRICVQVPKTYDQVIAGYRVDFSWRDEGYYVDHDTLILPVLMLGTKELAYLAEGTNGRWFTFPIGNIDRAEPLSGRDLDPNAGHASLERAAAAFVTDHRNGN